MEMSAFLALIDGRYNGFHKTCRALAYKSLRRWYAQHDYQPDSALSAQHLNDCTEHLESEIWNRLNHPRNGYNQSRGAASTWLYHTGWFVVANYMRDVIAPDMFRGIHNEHAESECRPQQAADRLAWKFGRYAVNDLTPTERKEQRSTIVRTLLAMDKRERRVFWDWANGRAAQDTARLLGVSQPTVSVIRNSLREEGLIPPVGGKRKTVAA